MIKFKWNIPESALFDIAKGSAVINREGRRTLDSMTAVVQTNVKFSAPVGATGQLRNSIGRDVVGLKGSVFDGVPYGFIIEKGRDAAPVSRDGQLSLQKWIKRSTKGQKWFRSFKEKHPKTTVKGAAFVLARSMKNKKRKPNPFFSRGIDRSRSRLKREGSIFLERLVRGLIS